MKKRYLVSFFICLMLLPTSVWAGNVAISAYPSPSEAQIATNTSYIEMNFADTELSSGYEGSFYVKNHEDTEKKVVVRPLVVMPSGGWDYHYSPDLNEYSESLYNPELIRALEMPEEILLEPEERKEVSYQLESLAGIDPGDYLIGIALSENQGTESVVVEDGADFHLHNEFAFVMAMQLHVGEPETWEMHFDEEVTVREQDGTVDLLLTLQNPGQVIQEGEDFPYTVYTEEEEEEVFSGSREDVRMPPTSAVGVALPWKAEEIREGNYLLRIDNGSSQQDIPFEVDFGQMEEDEPREVTFIEEAREWWFWFLLGLLTMLILLMLFWLFGLWKRRSKKSEVDEEEEETEEGKEEESPKEE